MIDDLILLSGNDIPFPAAQVNIHQPTIKEIAYINEKVFFLGCELLTLDKDISLSQEDKVRLKDKSNFDIIMSIIKGKNEKVFSEHSLFAQMVLTLIFPKYKVLFQEKSIYLQSCSQDITDGVLNNDNYSDFQKILIKMFNITKKHLEQNYNPGGSGAEKIAKKLEARHKKLAEIKGQQKEEQKIAVISRYVSILAVGEHKDINDFMKYTVYQLFDEFQRYELKLSYDLYLKAKMLGAKDIKEVDDWMKDIHS